MNHKKLFLIVVITVLLLLLSVEDYVSVSRLNDQISTKRASKNVYFDLGANDGDSIENFLGVTNKSQGGNIQQKIPAQLIKAPWTIYAVEGDSVYDAKLLSIKEKYTNPHEIILLNGTIATTYDGFVMFYINENNRYGNSIKANHPDAIRSNKKEKKPCVDIAKLVKQYNEDDFVFIKMDIEGEEYNLIIHLLKENALRLIDVIVVEYHTYVNPFKTVEGAFSSLFQLYNITQSSWK